jgi:hypothetical protein
MAENAQITLEEAKQLYNSFDVIKPFLLSKFSKDELDGSTVTQEEFNKFFEDTIFPLIDCSKTRYLDNNGNGSKIQTSRIELRNSDNKLLFEYDQKKHCFWYSYDRVYTIFQKQFLLQNDNIYRLMKILVKKHFGLHIVKPDNIGMLLCNR